VPPEGPPKALIGTEDSAPRITVVGGALRKGERERNKRKLRESGQLSTSRRG